MHRSELPETASLKSAGKSIGVGLFSFFLMSFGPVSYANDDYASVEDGGEVIVEVLANDNLQNIDPYSMYIVNPTSHGYLDIAYEGAISYTHYSGSGSFDSFTYTVANYDGQYSNPITVNLTVGGSEVGYDDSSSASVSDGGTVVLEVVNDPNLDSSTMYIYEATSFGYLNIVYPGAVSYSHYEGSETFDTFSYVVADYYGNYSDPVVVSISVGDQPTENNYPQQPIAQQPSPAPQTPAPQQDYTGSNGWWAPRASDQLKWQMQLQGDLRIIDGVDVYAVDYTASQESINAAKALGAKVLCYISAGSAENWRDDFYDFPDYVVGNAYQNWPGEWWLNTRDIGALAPVMRARMQACRDKGFDGIDADNVNGYVNDTGFGLSRQDSINYIRWLADEAHSLGMAFSLKNSESLVADVIDSVDMMQSESCFEYGNCYNAGQMAAAGKPVFAVEYVEVIGEGRFWQACAVAAEYNLSMIYRDIALQPYGPYLSCN